MQDNDFFFLWEVKEVLSCLFWFVPGFFAIWSWGLASFLFKKKSVLFEQNNDMKVGFPIS